MPQVVQDPGERPLFLHSRLAGPLRSLSFLRRALLLAELAMISYNDPREAEAAARAVGFPDVAYYDNDGAQAYRFRNQHDCVIACRGTEPNDWNDIRADAHVAAALAESVGRVHRGFKTEVDDLWPMLEAALADNRLPLWFCGHSLGGAMATIAAGRCALSPIRSNPEELYTFGSPRVGDHRYTHHVRLVHYRWVNNNDLVTRVPPPWMGYRHCGQEMYFDRRGRLRNLGGYRRLRDRWRGFWRGLSKQRLDHFSDHSIHRYIAHLSAAVAREDEVASSRMSQAA